MNAKVKRQIRETLLNRLNFEEFKTLSNDMGINPDVLPGEGFEGKVREFLNHIDQRKLTSKFFDELSDDKYRHIYEDLLEKKINFSGEIQGAPTKTTSVSEPEYPVIPLRTKRIKPVQDYVERQTYKDRFDLMAGELEGQRVFTLSGLPGTGKSAFLQMRHYEDLQNGILSIYLDLRSGLSTCGRIAQEILSQMVSNLSRNGAVKTYSIVATRGKILSEITPEKPHEHRIPAWVVSDFWKRTEFEQFGTSEIGEREPEIPRQISNGLESTELTSLVPRSSKLEKTLDYSSPPSLLSKSARLEIQTEIRETRVAGPTWAQAAQEFAYDFANSLSELANDEIHLYIDTLEILKASATKEWLLNDLLPALMAGLPKLVIVVAGQKTFTSEAGGLPAIAPEKRLDVEFLPFTGDEAKKYLHQVDIQDQQEIDAVVSFSGNLPLIISSYVMARRSTDGADVSVPLIDPSRFITQNQRKAFLLEHIISRIGSSVIVELIKKGAILRHFDKELLRNTVLKDITESDWEELLEWPFIQIASPEDELSTYPVSFHDIIRGFVQDTLRSELSWREIQGLHTNAAKWILQEVKSLAPKRRSVQLEGKILDGLYHCCRSGDVDLIKNFLLDQCAEAIESSSDENLEFCNTMLNLVGDEYGTTSEELNSLTEVLKQGRDAIAARNFENAVPMLKKLIGHPTTRQALLPGLTRAYAHILAIYDDKSSEAIEVIEKLLEKNSEDTKTLFILARVQKLTQDWNGAIETLHHIVGIGGIDTIKAHIELAHLFVEIRQKTNAEASLSGALKLVRNLDAEEERIEAYETIGDTYANLLSDYDNAIIVFRQSLAVNPKRESTALKLAAVFTALKRWQDASKALYDLAEISNEENRVSHLAAAIIAFSRSGKKKEAETRLKELCKQNPTAINAFDGLASFYEEEQRWEEARQVHLSVMENFQENQIISRIKAINCLLRIGKENEAEEELTALINEFPDNYEVAIGAAVIYQSLHQWFDSIHSLKKVIAISKDQEQRAEAYERVGDIYRDHLKEFEEAETAYRESYAAQPRRYSAFVGLAKACEEFKKWEKAIEAHREVGKAQPGYRIVSAAKAALCTAKAGKVEEAERELLRLREAHPHEVQVAVALAQLYEEQERWEDAIGAYSQVGSIDAEMAVESYLKMGELYKKQGKESEAKDAFRSAEEASAQLKEGGKSLLRTAVIHHQMGNPEQAERALLKAVELDPESRHTAYTNLGAIYKDQQRYEEAQAMFARAIEINPGPAEPYYGMAQLLEAQQRWDEAIAAHMQVAEKFPNARASAWEHIGDIHRDHTEQWEKAEEAYQKSLDVEPKRASAIRGMINTYEKYEQWGKAIEAYQALAEISEEERFFAYAKVATCLAQMGKVEEAERELLRLREAHPHEVQVAVALAQLYEEQERWEDAVEAYKVVSSLDNSLKGIALTQVGTLMLENLLKPEDSLLLFKEALPFCNEDPVNVLMQVARAYEVLGNEVEALSTYETIEKVLSSQHKNNTSNTVIRRYGWYFFKMGNFGEAEEMCKMVEGDISNIDKKRSILIIAAIEYLEGKEKINVFQKVPTGTVLTKSLTWEIIHDIRAVAKRSQSKCALQAFIDEIQSFVV
jgi:tetratricopeptide (TPR) repeat protein